jgi:hypothetical protein
MISRIADSDTARTVSLRVAQVEQEAWPDCGCSRPPGSRCRRCWRRWSASARRCRAAARRCRCSRSALASPGSPRPGHQRPGREVQARLADGGELAEEQLDRLLFRAHGVEARQRARARWRRARPIMTVPLVKPRPSSPPSPPGPFEPPAAPAHEHAQLVLPFFISLVDFGDLRAVSGTPAAATAVVVTAVAAVATAAPPGAAAVIGHRMPFRLLMLA